MAPRERTIIRYAGSSYASYREKPLTEQLIESFNDDGEKFGGERVLKILKDERAVDVLTICCRWVS